jgi:hypothetical protein
MMLNEMRPVLEIAPGPDQLHEPASRFSFSQIDKPIDGRDHDRPADDITYRHGNQIADKKIAPGQFRKICRRFADGPPE